MNRIGFIRGMSSGYLPTYVLTYLLAYLLTYVPYRVHPRHVLGVRPLDEGVVGFDRYNWLGGRAVSTWVREVQ